jgi:hypothetical protein
LTPGSERFQPSDDIGIGTPVSGASDSFELRFCFSYGFAFVFQIHGKPNRCSKADDRRESDIAIAN